MITLILNNIRSRENVGAIFRSADAFGVTKIYLCGYTPAPTDRFGRADTKLSKAALGAEETMNWAHADVHEVVSILKSQGTTVVALEQTPTALPLNTYVPPAKLALVVGNEVDGVTPDVLMLCDQSVEIPMLGHKESLNVATATGIALYHCAHHTV